MNACAIGCAKREATGNTGDPAGAERRCAVVRMELIDLSFSDDRIGQFPLLYFYSILNMDHSACLVFQ